MCIPLTQSSENGRFGSSLKPSTAKSRRFTRLSRDLKACSHDPFLRIRFLLVPKIRSYEHIEDDLPTHGSVSLKNGWKWNMLYFHPTLFLKDERCRQILHDIPVIVLATNWRFFVRSENRIVWTHYKRPSDILTTKTQPWNRTVWTPASNFWDQESGSLKLDRVNGP